MKKMKIKNFKSHTIVRSTPAHRNDYHAYKPYLKKDFCGRCAFCNLSDASITTPFEVEHLIPRAVFKEIRTDLETDYKNLVYACKKCNGAKSSQFEGDISAADPHNNLFYDPVLVDYNTIFYRNELGAIDSDDDKGKKMIELLKLYRPIHILGWLCEEINNTADKLRCAIDQELNEDRKKKLQTALEKLNEQYRKYNCLFIASYNEEEFQLKAE